MCVCVCFELVITAAMVKSGNAQHAYRKIGQDSICFMNGRLVSIYKWEIPSRTRIKENTDIAAMQRSFEKLNLCNSK